VEKQSLLAILYRHDRERQRICPDYKMIESWLASVPSSAYAAKVGKAWWWRTAAEAGDDVARAHAGPATISCRHHTAEC